MATGQWYQCPTVAEHGSAQGYGTSCLAFDPYHELLWTGGQNGSLTSYVVDLYDEGTLQRYTSCTAHASDVRQIVATEEGIVTLAGNELRYSQRGGLRLSSYGSERLSDLQCMAAPPNSTHTFFVGGLSDNLAVIDMARSRLLREEAVRHGSCVLKVVGDRLLAAGQTNGQVVVRDMVSLRTEYIIDAHTGTISDIEVKDNLLVTCGFSARLGQYVVDGLVKVYDVRTMKVVNMIQFPAGPALLRFMPGEGHHLCVASQSGHFQIVDLDVTGGGVEYLYGTDTQGEAITAMDVSTSGGLLAFADTAGLVHTWAIDDPAGVCVNTYSRDIEYPAPLDPVLDVDLFDDDVPLSIVPMAYTDEALLSDWPIQLVKPMQWPSVPLDPDVAKNMKMVDFVGYAPNPGTRLRNQVPYASPPGHRRDKSESVISRVPRVFRRKDITYSRLGAEDFDFGKHNRTSYSGLEAHSPNAYCNALVQMMYHTEPIRSIVLRHFCAKDNCLTCELAFLFHMIDLAEGQNCVAGNFLRTFRATSQAQALGLVLTGDEQKVDYGKLVQDCNRFLFNHLTQDLANPKDGKSEGATELGNVLGSTTAAVTKCLACGRESERRLDTLFFDLVYPDVSGPAHAAPTFTDLLRASMTRETETKAWCEDCRAYKTTASWRTVSRLADVLAVGCQAKTEADLALWHTEDGVDGTFVPDVISIDVSGQKLSISRVDGSPTDTETMYQIVAAVVYVADATCGGNVVVEIKGPNGWHLFNDFAVAGLSAEEATHFNTTWKVPCVLYYARCNLPAKYPPLPIGHTHPIPTNVLLDDTDYVARLPRRASTAPRTFKPLTASQLPGSGYHVALDAEFVALNMEEKGIKSDGTKSTIKPSQLCLARVSAIHGEGPRFGEAFLDDYIATTEPVMDYLTQFSGIHPGDLDPAISSKHLVTLKATYVKLRALADSGVVFVGHGLKKDFRIINMVVPKAQVIDTVDLFYVPRQRRISLRFLAWYLLNIDVQTGHHDSIEDARTALYLYQKYRQLVEEGTLEKTVKELYDAGRTYKWKAPHWDS